MKNGIYLNDSIHGLIPLTEYERRIVSTIGFNRLHDVYQNSTVYLTFPTNRTKRFEHSVGTMKLCSDMFFQSLLNTTDSMLSEFFEIFDREYATILDRLRQQMDVCEEKLGSRLPKAMPQIELDKLRHSLIPNNIPDQYKVIHLILIQSIRAAALLHDIGHPPFSHIVEFALKDVYLEYKDKAVSEQENAKEFVSIMSKYFEGNKKLHEQMGDEISEGILSKIIMPISEDDEKYDENLFELLILESVKRIFAEDGAFKYLHRIIDSSLDGDRLDYVTRDVINSGKDSGKIEYSRIINDMQLFVENGEIFFCVPIKAVSSVEDFVKRRYNSYKDIIYHHRVIQSDYILEGIVKDLVKKYLNETVSETQRDSEVLIPFDISGLWFPLGDKKSAIQANALSQWNDSWLTTVLRQIYYTEYYHNEEIEEGSGDFVLEQRLAELLRNSKRYHSLIKRSENFKIIDDAVKLEIIKQKGKIEEFLGKENEPSCGDKSTELIHQMLENSMKNSSGFILSFIWRYSKEMKIEAFEQMVREIVEVETNHIVTNLKTYDTVTLFKRISIGLDSPIYFYNHKEKISTLKDISGIADILQLDSDYLPVFYIYILAKDKDGVLKEKREELLGCIGKRIGAQIMRRLGIWEEIS
ncbi:HD domain-containing protein [Lachnoclostridium phytofermentans]|uniref:HD superfamily phosphohydrolase-like protein n=1 Tax=Lachnoclostridium phytofermentans (strain ATCC 700394 / DSM 18823 / ISDg) TaxID=357809 RepID=A9KLJ0_LACP7|nr:HD domain-containing protein [Lachnoclostridium phytofermentans]ABX41319.1 HD superfamily phosphohydrolase-like protein [Lachnoclostridium phytofermentans ISDg]